MRLFGLLIGLLAFWPVEKRSKRNSQRIQKKSKQEKVLCHLSITSEILISSYRLVSQSFLNGMLVGKSWVQFANFTMVQIVSRKITHTISNKRRFFLYKLQMRSIIFMTTQTTRNGEQLFFFDFCILHILNKSMAKDKSMTSKVNCL